MRRCLPLLLLPIVLLACRADPCAEGRVNVFATELWYLEDVNPVAEYSGNLTANPNPDQSPGGRLIAYVLEETPVYQGGDESFLFLRQFLDRDVLIRGKLTDVGFGPELWPGTIECVLGE